MKKISPVNWFRNIPISKKLYFTVGIMASLIFIELFTLYFAINTLSSVRAYVGAEGLWSKSQKDAAYFLQKYGRSHDEKDYRSFLSFLKVPQGDHKARLELLKAAPDYAIARQGFIEGRVHPDDINGAINLFRRFHSVYYINKAIGIWAKGDTLISEQATIGDELYSEITSLTPSQERINNILSRIDPLNDRLTKLEDDFSYTLSEGSRWLTGLVLKLLLGLVLTVEVCGLSITILVSRGIAKGLKEIIISSEKIAKGDYTVRAEAFSGDEIGILANAFNDMTDKLEDNINALKDSELELKISKNIAERLLAVKEKFLANMSHEIRTPMNAVIGFTGMLEDTKLSDDQQQFVEAIKLSSQNLMTIINDILDISKIESGMVILEEIPFSVYKIFDSLKVILQQPTASKKLVLNLHIDKKIPPLILGDPARLTQVLLNLADNAIKFTDAGTIYISASLQKETTRNINILFSVEDTGKGIPADKLSVIFERFSQASMETTRKYGGTGLGLSIAKSLVELHNSTISVESELDKGSVFSFTISYQKTNAAQQPNVQNELPVINKKLKILLAEDNVINQKLALVVLGKFGFEIDVASNGKIAIDKLKQQQYDIILMDMQMPEMDGYETTRIIRHELKSNIPIIALTAHAMAEEKEKCLALGMNDYISKPFDKNDLYQKIAAFF